MGDPKLTVVDSIFSAGQNEGIERAVLPAPQLRSVMNARMRKAGRWGKRWGSSLVSTTNTGTGLGLPRCLGSGFAIIDDRCSTYDPTAAAFVNPATLTVPNLSSTYITNPRISGAVSGWLPDTSFFPVPARSQSSQTTTPCANTYAFGYLWTAIQFTDPNNTTDTLIRVVATSPVDQSLVFVQEIAAANISFGGLKYPKLILVGSTLVLTYLYTASAATSQLNARVATSISSGFGAETQLVGGGAGNVSTYDASTYSSTQFATVYIAGGFCGVNLFTSAFGASTSKLITDVNTITSVTIVGSSSTPVYVGFGTTASTKVVAYTTGFGAALGTATLDSGVAGTRPLLCLLSGGGVRCAYSIVTSMGVPLFRYRDVSAAAALVTSYTLTQYSAYPISPPFAVGSRVYVWCIASALQLFGSATLIRLPDASEFGTPNGGTICCPLEMSVQDYIVSPGQSFTFVDLAGLPVTTQIGTSASYAVTIPTLYAVPDVGTTWCHDFRVLQVKHFSTAAAKRSVSSVSADSCAFAPLGTLTRVDKRGAVEEGFCLAPQLFSLTPSAGGGMTASSTYFYTVIFKARNLGGRYEVSAPASPVLVNLVAGQGTVTLSFSSLNLGARSNVQAEIYRTLANGKTYYLVAAVDGTPNPAGGGSLSFVDALSDSTISAHQALYIQTGQAKANAFPPASSFACAGGQRLFLGGLMRPDVVQCSKLIFGDQSPSFADSDAFRIVLPAPCTGIAWMDGLVLFTAEGIYTASGDGPADDGTGDFGGLNRLPFQLGCIEPRSVFTIGEGTFFQSARGLYLLPRGAGDPVAAGDAIMDTLATYPVITGCVAMSKPTEQTVRWSCVDAACTVGAQIVYDLVHKCWSVDTITDVAGATRPQAAIGPWLSSEIAMCSPDTISGRLRVTSGAFIDNTSAIAMSLSTGDLRPFGAVGHGNITRIGVLAELRSACSMSVTAVTDQGSAAPAARAFDGSNPAIGADTYVQLDMGNTQLKNVTALSIQLTESSAVEGLAFIGFATEQAQSEGLRLSAIADRIT